MCYSSFPPSLALSHEVNVIVPCNEVVEVHAQQQLPEVREASPSFRLRLSEHDVEELHVPAEASVEAGEASCKGRGRASTSQSSPSPSLSSASSSSSFCHSSSHLGVRLVDSAELEDASEDLVNRAHDLRRPWTQEATLDRRAHVLLVRGSELGQ